MFLRPNLLTMDMNIRIIKENQLKGLNTIQNKLFQRFTFSFAIIIQGNRNRD